VLAGQQAAGVTTKVTLWADGKSEPAVFTEQGTDVLISLPQDMTPRQQVMLRSDSPVTLQVPANWRGSLQVPLEITGE
ncbi:fimbrial protein, partial [Salmonella enterica subsp. enterica serovar Javiana]|nr:fimbrial protein [Salmonella enterica subsp. enterica serovar Javiana]